MISLFRDTFLASCTVWYGGSVKLKGLYTNYETRCGYGGIPFVDAEEAGWEYFPTKASVENFRKVTQLPTKYVATCVILVYAEPPGEIRTVVPENPFKKLKCDGRDGYYLPFVIRITIPY